MDKLNDFRIPEHMIPIAEEKAELDLKIKKVKKRLISRLPSAMVLLHMQLTAMETYSSILERRLQHS